jgi:hypothetical protein
MEKTWDLAAGNLSDKTGEDKTGDATPPETRRFLALLQGLDDSANAEAEWRRLERQWVIAVLHQPVIAFDDVQIAAELLARHRWEDAGKGSGQSVTAYERLRELRARRGVRESLECLPTDR